MIWRFIVHSYTLIIEQVNNWHEKVLGVDMASLLLQNE